MEKKNKKYSIRKSELNEIILEALIVEAYNPNDFKANFSNGQLPKGLTINSYLSKIGPGVKSIAGHMIPDNWKERVENGDSRFLQWLLGLLGANTAGRVGPDYFPNMKDWSVFGGAGSKAEQNPDAHQQLNVAAAIRYLMNHATSTYNKLLNGKCAKNVRAALNFGGLDVPHGIRATAAKHYIIVLPRNGWYEIDINQAGQPGDVCVIDAYDGHPYGHISMCCGRGLWVSDFVQKDMFGVKGHKPPLNLVHVYRYKNIV